MQKQIIIETDQPGIRFVLEALPGATGIAVFKEITTENSSTIVVTEGESSYEQTTTETVVKKQRGQTINDFTI